MTLGQANEQAKRRMQAAMTSYAKAMPMRNFDRALVEASTVVSASMDLEDDTTAKATFRITIPSFYTNNPVGEGETHGGAVATLFDNSTSITLLATKRYWGQGMSRSMNVTYLRTPKEADQCLIEAEFVHIGRRIATIHGRLMRESDRVLLAVCLHEKMRVEDGKGYEEFYASL